MLFSLRIAKVLMKKIWTGKRGSLFHSWLPIYGKWRERGLKALNSPSLTRKLYHIILSKKHPVKEKCVSTRLKWNQILFSSMHNLQYHFLHLYIVKWNRRKTYMLKNNFPNQTNSKTIGSIKLGLYQSTTYPCYTPNQIYEQRK